LWEVSCVPQSCGCETRKDLANGIAHQWFTAISRCTFLEHGSFEPGIIKSTDHLMANASIIPTPRILSWYTDPKTVQAATAHKLPLPHSLPARQVNGCETNTEIWRDRIIHPPTWRDPIRSDPAEIIKQFKQGRYTQGLALVVSWGGMGRRAKAIYGEATPATIMHIERTLQICARDIQESLSIDNSWQSLAGSNAGELHWSEGMTVKDSSFLMPVSWFREKSTCSSRWRGHSWAFVALLSLFNASRSPS
jgi:hypothetical protein